MPAIQFPNLALNTCCLVYKVRVGLTLIVCWCNMYLVCAFSFSAGAMLLNLH